MHLVNTAGDLLGLRRGLEVVHDVDPADDEHTVFLLNLAGHICGEEVFVCLYLARSQRAAEGSGQSATRRSDHIVDRGRMLGLELNSVVARDRAVHPKDDRLFGGWQICEA